MDNVALYICEADRLVCNGVPKYCITNFGVQAKDVPFDRTFYLEENLLNHIVNHYTLDKLDAIFSCYYYMLNNIYVSADKIHNNNDSVDKLLFHSPNTKFGTTKVVPFPSFNTKHDYEYDVHAAYASLLMFQYYLSDKDEGHAESDVCENPLKDVRNVAVANNHLLNSIEDQGLYLCSNLASYHKEYSNLLMMAKTVIRMCWKTLKIDCSHLVYALIISQVMKSMYSKSKYSTIRAFDALLQLSSIKFLLDNGDDYFGYYSDAVFCKRKKSNITVADKIPGKRYYKRFSKSKSPVHDLAIPSIQVVQDFHDVESYGFGWASFDRKHLSDYDLEKYDMFHVDMKSAYPSRYYHETGKHIDKKTFGIVKCFDSRLYQKIRLQVSMDALEIFRRVGRENVVYWKTDGGICLLEKGVDPYILLGDICQLHIDRIISSDAMFLPEWIKVPEHLSKFHRAWAYKVKTDRSVNIFWANLYEECIKEILEYNGIILPDNFTQVDVIERVNNGQT